MTSSLSGMTGFGRGIASGENAEVTIEARSVNSKGLDIRMRLPSGLEALESELRNQVKAVFNRGSVSINIQVVETRAQSNIQIDQVVLDNYAKLTGELVDKGLAEKPRADGLLMLKGVIQFDENQSEDEQKAMMALILKALDDALSGLKSARYEEGAALQSMLNDHLNEIEALRAKAVGMAAAQPQAIRARLKAKLDELLPQGFDEDRLAQEAAALAVKADVREELDRLEAHIEAARRLIQTGSPCGRKLDFLSQEFNREANTLCSKSSDKEMTETGLALKAVIDQMREQVQNVE